jgi:hypothetical protein
MHALKLTAIIDSSRRVELRLPSDTPEGKAEVIVLVGEHDAVDSTSASAEVDESLEQLFAAIDRMPRKRLTKDEIDRYLAEERASWD